MDEILMHFRYYIYFSFNAKNKYTYTYIFFTPKINMYASLHVNAYILTKILIIIIQRYIIIVV